MSLDATLFEPDRGLDLSLSVERGRVLALLGPNGAGKSSTLGAVAGLLRPRSGVVDLHGRRLLDTAVGIDVPVHRRGVATLTQNPLLFPHMTVLDNVAFGPRGAGFSRRVARAQAYRWLAQVDAEEFADRYPSRLSGGQAQRVALARALAARPDLLLLDEPMAALDVGAAPTLRRTLRAVLRESDRTAVIVTHDVLDALALADSVVVLESGRVVEAGPVRSVMSTPRSAFAARLAGVNLLAGSAVGADGVRTADGLILTGPAAEDSGVAPTAGDPAVAVFSPDAVSVHRDRPAGSVRNVLPVTVTALDTANAVVRIHTETASGAEIVATVTATAAAELDLVPGTAVHVAVKAVQVRAVAARRPA